MFLILIVGVFSIKDALLCKNFGAYDVNTEIFRKPIRNFTLLSIALRHTNQWILVLLLHVRRIWEKNVLSFKVDLEYRNDFRENGITVPANMRDLNKRFEFRMLYLATMVKWSSEQKLKGTIVRCWVNVKVLLEVISVELNAEYEIVWWFFESLHSESIGNNAESFFNPQKNLICWTNKQGTRSQL